MPNPNKWHILNFDGGIPDYRLNGKLNPDKTFETSDLSGTCTDKNKEIKIN